jgi:hypothetical protein
MNASELLRRRLEAMPKVIAPRPIGDASMMTQIQRYKATRRSDMRRSDGQMQEVSSEFVISAIAGCAVCLSPPQETVTVACCPPEPEPEIKPLALIGRVGTCCGTSGGKPELAPPRKCCTPGNITTMWGTDINPNYIPHYSACDCRRPVVPCEDPCCDENGFLLPG